MQRRRLSFGDAPSSETALPKTFHRPLAVCGSLVALALAGQVSAEPFSAPPESGPTTVTLVGEAAAQVGLSALISKGQFEDALHFLQALPPTLRQRSDYLYLEAQLHRKLGRRLQAIDLYNRLVTQAPRRQLIQLELAQTYFEIGDDRAAEQWFRLALSAPMPTADETLAHKYLELIRKRGSWRYATSLALVPDNDLNQAPTARTVQIFGLPFQLAPEARPRSGVGASISAAAERSTPISGPWRLDTLLYGSFLDNPGAAYDQSSLGAKVGPQFVSGEKVTTLLGGYENFRYGGRTLFARTSLNGRVDLPTRASVVYNLTGEIARYRYPDAPSFDANFIGAGMQRTKYIDPTSLWRFNLAAAYNQARRSFQSYRSGGLSVGYYHTLPLGMAVYVEPAVSVNDYIAPHPIFGAKRWDVLESLSARLTLRNWTLAGFSPYLGGTLTHVNSTLSIYSYNRQRLDIGVSRAF
jgi:hypothetical protein